MTALFLTNLFQCKINIILIIPSDSAHLLTRTNNKLKIEVIFRLHTIRAYRSALFLFEWVK